MITFREAQEVTDWMVVFHKSSASWVGRVVPGRFKHVSMLGWAPLAKVWIMFDVALTQSKMIVLPEGKAALDRIAIWTADCSILKMTSVVRVSKAPRFGNWCVPSARHLLGLSGGAVLTPDHLWKECLRHNAKVVFDDEHGQRQHGQSGGGRVSSAPAEAADRS